MLTPNYDHDIPEMTVEVAKAAFPKGNAVMKIRDKLGPLFADDEFAALYPAMGQPAESPARLALVTILQFMENLTDREAADAVRSRIDWKYLLGLELTDPGFHYSVLSEFRQRLLEQEAENLLLDQILEQCEAAGLLKGQSKQRTDSTRVMAKIRSLNRVELAGETIRRVLDDIAQIAPDWLKDHLKKSGENGMVVRWIPMPFAKAKPNSKNWPKRLEKTDIISWLRVIKKILRQRYDPCFQLKC